MQRLIATASAAGDFTLRHLHWFLIAAGLAGIAAVEAWPALHQGERLPGTGFAENVASAMLSGGVFSALVKSWLFTKIFRDRVQEVMRSAEFLESLHSLADAWRNLAAGIYRNRLPSLAEQLRGALAERVPDDKRWFYKSYKQIMYVEWEDDTRRRLKLTRELVIEIIKQSPETPFPYRTAIIAATGASTRLDWTVEYLRIDERILDLQKDLDVTTSPSGERIDLSLKAPLVGLLRHIIERHSVSFLTLADDPSYFFEAENYIGEVELGVYLRSGEIGVNFFEIGIQAPFQRLKLPRKEGHPISMGYRTDKLLFPGQGFMLIFTRK